ncbi:MAG: DMT family transporter, partial [Pseudomonadota bacterium]
PSNQVVFLYKFIVLIMILPWVFKDGFKTLITKKLPYYIIGGIFGTIATLCLIYSLKYIQIANVVYLNYLEKILLFLIGIFCFKELFSAAKLIAIIISFMGAIIVLQPELFSHIPEFSIPDIHYIFIAISIIFWVIYCIIVKLLGRTETVKTQTFYTVLISTILSSFVALFSWNLKEVMGIKILLPSGFIAIKNLSLDLSNILILLLVSLCYLTRSIASFKAFKHGELSIIMPFGYSKIIFSAIIGFYLFNEMPKVNEYIGYIMIIISGILLFRKFKT